MNEPDRLRRLFGRIRNDLRTISHTYLDRALKKLFVDIASTLSLIEAEMMKSEVATEERVK